MMSSAVVAQQTLEEEEEEEQLRQSPPESPRAPSGSAPQETDEEGEEGEDEESRANVYDVVEWLLPNGARRRVNVQYAPHLSEFNSVGDAMFRLQVVLPNGTRGGAIRVAGKDVVSVVYFEQRMGRMAAEAVELESLEVLAAVDGFAEVPDDLLALHRAERLLTVALAEHDSAVGRRLRRGLAWDELLRQPLLRALANVRLGRVESLLRRRLYEQAQSECERLAADLPADHPQTEELDRHFDTIFQRRAKPAYDRGDYATVRRLLDELATRRRDGLPAPARKIQTALVEQARQRADEALALVEQAEQLPPADAGGAVRLRREALQRYQQAVDFWPPLVGLGTLRRRIGQPVLRCAYAELPLSLSPLEARTPVERHAVSLLYEGLVGWVDAPQGGTHGRRQLALGRPMPLARGREFHLPGCVWSDSQADRTFCTIADVYATFRLLANEALPGQSPAWSRLVDGVYDAQPPGPLVLELRLARDHWQPLSLMDAAILPAHRLGETGEGESLEAALGRLREEPVGTGPYRLFVREADRVEFGANPHYRLCAEGLPRIKQIAFERLPAEQAVARMLDGQLELIYDVPPAHVNALRQGGIPVVALQTPSVCLLAPNHRRMAMRSRDLRLAIAVAIDREAVLDEHFRMAAADEGPVALTGPYPKDSWAYNPNVKRFGPSEDADREAARQMARVLARDALRALHQSSVTLRLVYPLGDPRVERACRQMCSQVEQAIAGVRLEPDGVAPQRFYEQVVGRHGFDLAYWRHDFKDPTFWLEPLLDQDEAARREWGPNFMGYTQDPTIAELFGRINMHKRFEDVRSWTHQLHEHIARRAIVIPLWQLDTYVALSPHLRLGNAAGETVRPRRNEMFNNRNLFADAAYWELENDADR
jgi:tetratricopeptide (TPR) repeat protein